MFQTFTVDLQRLADWLQQCGIRTVAMESTGVYWIPLFQILEQRKIDVRLVTSESSMGAMLDNSHIRAVIVSI